jgi:CRP-like cAMP-binding protein
VVIDGKLRAWVQGDHGPIELSVMTRGATIGEVGLFEQPRSANVEVVDPARVLCITRPDLERLRRRYPRIAAKLLWNLNAVFAQRLLSTTAKVH